MYTSRLFTRNGQSKLFVILNGAFDSDNQTLLFSLVPKKALRNPGHIVNVVAGIGSEYTHAEVTLVDTALTMTADVKHRNAHIMWFRTYKEYHKKFTVIRIEFLAILGIQIFVEAHMISQRN